MPVKYAGVLSTRVWPQTRATAAGAGNLPGLVGG